MTNVEAQVDALENDHRYNGYALYDEQSKEDKMVNRFNTTK